MKGSQKSKSQFQSQGKVTCTELGTDFDADSKQLLPLDCGKRILDLLASEDEDEDVDEGEVSVAETGGLLDHILGVESQPFAKVAKSQPNLSKSSAKSNKSNPTADLDTSLDITRFSLAQLGTKSISKDVDSEGFTKPISIKLLKERRIKRQKMEKPDDKFTLFAAQSSTSGDIKPGKINCSSSSMDTASLVSERKAKLLEKSFVPLFILNFVKSSWYM